MGRITDPAEALASALEALDEYGLLLLSDAALPSIVTMITGEPLQFTKDNYKDYDF